MNVLVIFLGALFSAGLAIMARQLRHAPCGYEDHTGFHRIDPQVFEQQAPVMPAVGKGVALTPVESAIPEFAMQKNYQRKPHETKTLVFRRADDGAAPAKAALNHAA